MRLQWLPVSFNYHMYAKGFFLPPQINNNNNNNIYPWPRLSSVDTPLGFRICFGEPDLSVVARLKIQMIVLTG